MATKWDPLVLKYQRQNQQELGRLTELRRHLKETESNRDKVAERQTHFRRQLHTNTLREIDDWRVMKSFLADLDILRNNCEGQLIEIRELIDRAQAQNQRTAQILQKYEHTFLLHSSTYLDFLVFELFEHQLSSNINKRGLYFAVEYSKKER